MIRKLLHRLFGIDPPELYFRIETDFVIWEVPESILPMVREYLPEATITPIE